MAGSGIVRWFAKQALGHERVDVGMEIEVFAESVQGEDDARDAVRAIQRRSEVFGQALMGQSILGMART